MEFRELTEMSYKDISEELEQLIRALESDQLELEDSLRYYERGVLLVRNLKQRLETAEQKVETLMGELEPELDTDIDVKLS